MIEATAPEEYIVFWQSKVNPKFYGQGLPMTHKSAIAWAAHGNSTQPDLKHQVVWVGDKPRTLKPDDLGSDGLRKHA